MRTVITEDPATADMARLVLLPVSEAILHLTILEAGTHQVLRATILHHHPTAEVVLLTAHLPIVHPVQVAPTREEVAVAVEVHPVAVVEAAEVVLPLQDAVKPGKALDISIK